ncbi:MAG: type A chloramphenicol O-acetyltransferase [Oscillospiraceae bacterium]|nr:type A chloramphenicol O-acetyltransferase [Oscillospiraceae bacterium]
MAFHLIDLEHWERREIYAHFINEVRCTYAATVRMDVTGLKGQWLYPAMLWLLTQTVNQMPEFRTSHTEAGLGVYDEMHPAYTVLNRENRNFSVVWTECGHDYGTFLRAYEADTAAFAALVQFAAKPDRPANTFDISMIPWFSFTAFDIHVFDEGRYLLPVFTMGKSLEENGRRLLPLAIQVHHAVCDGYHVGRFIQALQDRIDAFAPPPGESGAQGHGPF